MTVQSSVRKARVLVTGFGPFPGVHDNPSARLIHWLANDSRWARRPEATLQTALLPVAWQLLPQLLAERLAAIDPDVVLHFGFHSGAQGFAVEDCARNHAAPAVDAFGDEWRRTEIVPGAPRLLKAPNPAAKLVAHLGARGLPASASTDAGRYLCNMLFYLSLERRLRTGRPSLVHFIHIPSLALGPRLRRGNAISRTHLSAGVAAIIGYNLARFRNVRSGTGSAAS